MMKQFFHQHHFAVTKLADHHNSTKHHWGTILNGFKKWHDKKQRGNIFKVKIKICLQTKEKQYNIWPLTQSIQFNPSLRYVSTNIIIISFIQMHNTLSHNLVLIQLYKYSSVQIYNQNVKIRLWNAWILIIAGTYSNNRNNSSIN